MVIRRRTKFVSPMPGRMKVAVAKRCRSADAVLWPSWARDRNFPEEPFSRAPPVSWLIKMDACILQKRERQGRVLEAGRDCRRAARQQRLPRHGGPATRSNESTEVAPTDTQARSTGIQGSNTARIEDTSARSELVRQAAQRSVGRVGRSRPDQRRRPVCPRTGSSKGVLVPGTEVVDGRVRAAPTLPTASWHRSVAVRR